MHFKIDRNLLLKSLSHIQGVVERRNTIPILSNVKIEAENAKLQFTATDMDVAVTDNIEAEILNAGSITVPAHTFHDIVKKLPDGVNIDCIYDQENSTKTLQINAAQCNFTLPIIEANDFPVIETGEITHKFTIKKNDFLKLLDKSKFAISTEETRYYLNGIYLHVPEDNKDKLRAVATDGHRLAQAEIPVPDGAQSIPGIIIPRKAVGEIRKLAEGTEQEVKVIVSKTKAKFIFPSSILTTKLIDGSFPDYQRVIPKENLNKLIVANADFSKAVDRVSTVSMEKSRAIKLSLYKNLLSLNVNSHDLGNAFEELEIDYDSQNLEIGFNSKYLLDISSQIQGKNIEILLSDSASPALITDPDQDGVIFVLMPMRV